MPASMTNEKASNDCNKESAKKEGEVQNSITNRESDQNVYFAIHRVAPLYPSLPIPSPRNWAMRGVAPTNGGFDFVVFNRSNVKR